MPDDARASRYMDYLPAIYQQGVQPGQPNFLGRFLLAFEQILTGLGDPTVDVTGRAVAAGLEEILEGISDPNQPDQYLLAGSERYFEPGTDLPPVQRAPSDFLPWLAGWVGLSLRGDLDEARQRDFISNAVQLYRRRGTRQGLIEAVRLYTRLDVSIDERIGTFQLDVNAKVGVDTITDGGPPHYFHVLILLNPLGEGEGVAEQRKRQLKAVSDILDMEKPAHTYYDLDSQAISFTIEKYSHVGVDTFLG